MATRRGRAANVAMQMEIDAAAMEVAALQRSLGNWNAYLDPKEGRANTGFKTSASSPILTSGVQAFNPSDVGFKLLPLDEVLGKSPPRKSEDAVASVPSGNTPSCAPISKTPSACRPRRATSWRQHPRNRRGCSPEARAGERRRLEKAVKSCGLILEIDPSAPKGETLRVAPTEKVRRTCKEQRHATQRLLEGLSVAAQPKSEGLSRTSTAHALLQVEGRHLAGLPCRPSSASSAPSVFRSQASKEAAQRLRPTTTGGLGRTMRRDCREQVEHGGLQDVPLHYVTSTSAPSSPRSETNGTSHALPTKHSADILRAAQEGKVPVHLTCSNAASGREDIGPPPKSLQEAILAAALAGAIPVRSITAAVTKPAGAGNFKTPAFISTSVGPSEISAPGCGSARSSDYGSSHFDDHFFNRGGVASEPSSESECEGDTDAQERASQLLRRVREEALQATRKDVMELQQFRRPPILVHERRENPLSCT